jgi:hypothetical protein
MREGPAQGQEVAACVRRVPVRNPPVQPGLLDERFRSFLTVEGRNVHHKAPGPNVAGDGDDDMMAPAQRGGHVRILESGDERE